MAKYIYCITDLRGRRDLDILGMNGGRSHLITYRDLSAAVSDVPFEEIDPTDENLEAHEKVNSGIMFDHNSSVVPMAFCTIVGSNADVAKIMARGYFSFRKNLLDLKNKFELGLKIFCDIEKLKEEHNKELYQKSKDIAEEIYDTINAIAEKSQLNDLIIDNMIMNGAFLLDRSRLDDFNKLIKTLDEKHGNNLLIKIVGPLAPYSFVLRPGESKL